MMYSLFYRLSVQRCVRCYKKSICLEANDQTLLVKPGCRSNIEYLHQHLCQKREEHLKQNFRKSKRMKTVQTKLLLKLKRHQVSFLLNLICVSISVHLMDKSKYLLKLDQR